ncbi:MAG: Gx transporter family protein [Eubacteriales bacterium]|nr:Gx transporter family protein [Eubacteriales bacterium]
MKTKLSFLGFFTAIAVICGYVESLIPVFAGVPGIKLGLANLSVLLILKRFSLKDAFLVSLARILIIGFFFGSLFSIIYSLAGASCSLLLMFLCLRTGKFSIPAVSVIGGITHNMAQLFIAIWLVETPALLTYFPVLLISGILTGLVIGFLTREIDHRLPLIR